MGLSGKDIRRGEEKMTGIIVKAGAFHNASTKEICEPKKNKTDPT